MAGVNPQYPHLGFKLKKRLGWSRRKKWVYGLLMSNFEKCQDCIIYGCNLTATSCSNSCGWDCSTWSRIWYTWWSLSRRRGSVSWSWLTSRATATRTFLLQRPAKGVQTRYEFTKRGIYIQLSTPDSDEFAHPDSIYGPFPSCQYFRCQPCVGGPGTVPAWTVLCVRHLEICRDYLEFYPSAHLPIYHCLAHLFSFHARREYCNRHNHPFPFRKTCN